MFSNVIYKLSAFSDYSSISYNQQDIIEIMQKFNDLNLVPSVFQEVLPNGALSKRMQFVGNNGLILFIINSGRIDIQITSEKKEGFSKDEIPNIKTKIISIYDDLYTILDKLASDPNRLAWYTSYIYFELIDLQKEQYRNRFLKDISFFNDGRLDDMVVRYATRKETDIDALKEKINIITTINRIEDFIGPDSPVDGYKIEYDINTWQGNKKNRFTTTNVETFINISMNYQEKLNKEFIYE